MKTSRTAPWVAGTVLLCLLLAAGFWFVLISPARAETSDMNAQAESEESRIEQLNTQLAGLKRDFENIDQFRSDLAGLTAEIPAKVDLANLTRLLQQDATEAGVFVTELSPGVPTPIVAPAPAAGTAPATTDGAAAPATETADGAAAADGTGAGAQAAPAAPAGPVGFYAVPISLTVAGSFDATVEFINKLSASSGRLIVTNSLVATAQTASAAEGGKPAVNDGDLQTVLQLWAFVLQDQAAAQPATGDAAAPTDPAAVPQIPVPNGQGNPFAVNN
jgi:Tfp pilus assembly protein PilO